MAKKVEEWLEAVKISTSLTEPDKIIPDYQTQLKAGEMLREDLGIKTDKNSFTQNNFFQIAKDQRGKYE